MRLRTIFLALGLLALPLPAAAQLNPSLSEAERGIRSGEAGEAAHLRIDSLRIDAHVVGRTADVTLELQIAATDAKSYEANLSLLLPADAVVTGYALDVEGKLIPGQLLEQPKARNVYEDEVRKGIDPGLAEVAPGNRFNTRIFPISAARPRQFRMRFAVPFDPAKGLVLPLARDAAIGRLEAVVQIDGYSAAPEVLVAGRPLSLARAGTSWHGALSEDKAMLRDSFAVSGGTLAEPIAIVRHDSGQAFFLISDAAPDGKAAPTRGGRLRIYWDRSRSHRDAPLDREIDALMRLVDTRAPEAIDLVSFASDTPQFVSVPDAAGLRAALKAMVYRGGTSLAGLDDLKLPDARDCVMVFDGQVTIDREADFAPDCRLSVLTASPDANGARLGRMAQHNGGKLVRVGEGGAAEAAAALAPGGSGVVAMRDGGGRNVDFRALPAGAGQWLLVGPVPDSGSLRVRLADGRERSYALQGAELRGEAAGALWAQQRIGELSDDPARHNAMAALSRRYQVAGPDMAFLVLESPEQYVNADVAPPRGFSDDWMRTWREAKAVADKGTAEAKRGRLEFAVEQWRQRQEWWAKRYVPAKRRAPAEPAPLYAPAPPPPPPPPPPAMVMPPEPAPAEALNRVPGVALPEAAADDAGELVVTGTRMRGNHMAASRTPVTVVEEQKAVIKVDLPDLLADRPYLAALNAAAPAQRLRVLAEQETAYGATPTFYLDTAEWFRLKGDTTTAALLLLSALELPMTDDETRQIVAFRLERDKVWDRAVEIDEQLAATNAGFRPQPKRDLALALAARGRSRGAAGRFDLERAFGLLAEVVLDPADDDFDGLEVVSLMEANALIPDIEAAHGSWSLDDRLLGKLDTDARIVIGWTMDDADIDLWVDEPNGERVMYSAPLSSAGGHISNDMTDGYGPEEYVIRRAPPGDYLVRVNGFDADRINPNGAGHVLIRLYRNFARPAEEQVMLDVDLNFQKGRNRNDEENTKPIATLHVGK